MKKLFLSGAVIYIILLFTSIILGFTLKPFLGIADLALLVLPAALSGYGVIFLRWILASALLVLCIFVLGFLARSDSTL